MNKHPSMEIFQKIKSTLELQIGRILNCKIIDSNNYLFVLTTSSGKFICKIYDPKGSIPDHEIKVHSLIPSNNFTREMVYFNTSKNEIKYDYAVYEYIEGKTLEEEIIKQTNSPKNEKLASQIFNYINLYSDLRSEGYGILNEDFIGRSPSWFDYHIEILINSLYFLMGKGFPSNLIKDIISLLINKEHIFSLSNANIVPIDLNLRNILVTQENNIKIIDIGSVISGDLYNSYGEFIAHTFNTIIGDIFLVNFTNRKDLYKIRLYGLLDCINILAFIARGSGNIFESRPWGNPASFFRLIESHLKFLYSEN